MPTKLRYSGRSTSFVSDVRILIVPIYIPEPPTPAILLPTIRALAVGEDAQMAEPISKIRTDAR